MDTFDSCMKQQSTNAAALKLKKFTPIFLHVFPIALPRRIFVHKSVNGV